MSSGGGCDISSSGLSCLNTDLAEVTERLREQRNISLPGVFISQSNISFLPDGLFSPSTRVQELHLVSCKLFSLADSSLTPLSSSLSYLDLSANFLSSLPPALASLTNLTHLQLSHNLIQHLNPNIFTRLPRLLSLDLAHNSLHQSLNLSLAGLQASLVSLSLAGNGLERFPPVFQQTFSRLESLDLSNNKLTGVPTSFMRRTPRLSRLLLDNNQLETVMLEPLPTSVKLLSLLHNRLSCDCKSLWLRRLLDRSEITVSLSPCFSPFSRNTLALGSFEGSALCSLSETDRIPKFFRVTDRDLAHFPSKSFASLKLSEVSPLNHRGLTVKISIQLEFYYNEYDWGIIYREIGSQAVIGENNKFYKTKFNLRDYAGDHFDWSPRTEDIQLPVEVRAGSGYYEVCLAVIETSTVYYLHQSLCTEVELLRREEEEEEVEVRVRPGVETARVEWTDNNTETVRVTVREWGESLPFISRLVSHNSSLVEGGLQPDTSYTVCVEPAQWRPGGGKHCQEFKTKSAAWLTRETAVATSAAVSSSSTMVVIFLLWCCCYRRKKLPGTKAGDCRKLDVNENESCHVKHEAGCSLGTGAGTPSRLWHQKHRSAGHSDQPLTHTSSCRSHHSHHPWLPPHLPQHSEVETESGSENSGGASNGVYDCIQSPPPPPAGSARVAGSLRSSQSLSTKYSEKKMKSHGQTGASQHHSQHHSQPGDAANNSDPAQFPPQSDIKINSCSGRVVLKKQFGPQQSSLASQPGQFHSFRVRPSQPYYRRAPVHHLYPYTVGPGPDLRRTTSTKEYSRLSFRRAKYYPATFSHAPMELRPLKMKKSFKKVGKTESLKMYTWSPYTSSLFYSDPKMMSSAVIGSPPLLQAPDGSLTTQDGLQF